MSQLLINRVIATRMADRARVNLDAYDKKFPKRVVNALVRDFPRAFHGGVIARDPNYPTAWAEACRRTAAFAASRIALEKHLALCADLADLATVSAFTEEQQAQAERDCFRTWGEFTNLLRESGAGEAIRGF